MENFKNLTDKINFNEKDDLIKIEKLLFKYPYYQNLHAFYLKSLKTKRNIIQSYFKKNLDLNSDRENLYNWLSKEINSKESDILEDNVDIKYDKKTFIDWITDNEKKDEISKQDRIDKFISNNPKIKSSVSSSNNLIIENNNFDKFEFMTETLAKIYLKQKKYDDAKRAFKILILNYPEKKSLFANEIKK